mmetsp:Transcript_119023/g.186728  ORF Transcript_119023/g.186728 Transcript_119023/m.186728 type:complete len:117 (+) Transcript_119023:95-445(+)
MAKPIEGSTPSRFDRLTAFAMSKFKPATPLYSLAFGAVGGLALSGLVYGYRTLGVLFFDHEYYKLQSRKRYFEKQLLFMREKEETEKAHYMAALAAEYDPVATRMPFKPLDPKYRF